MVEDLAGRTFEFQGAWMVPELLEKKSLTLSKAALLQDFPATVVSFSPSGNRFAVMIDPWMIEFDVETGNVCGVSLSIHGTDDEAQEATRAQHDALLRGLKRCFPELPEAPGLNAGTE